ncbi:structural maintenance of chromosomes protein 2-2 [Trichonephila clavipes]|uniref:Structural maintenance of chromosomes protein 2-2 n=1 Tax=Trichonephila clavipes TaxID=2585209 RepID=A0A8X6REC9_TRICX|nr:structural maintenance of chromosomes protein 2-2 [Trichonephila clavipes]
MNKNHSEGNEVVHRIQTVPVHRSTSAITRLNRRQKTASLVETWFANEIRRVQTEQGLKLFNAQFGGSENRQQNKTSNAILVSAAFALPRSTVAVSASIIIDETKYGQNESVLRIDTDKTLRLSVAFPVYRMSRYGVQKVSVGVERQERRATSRCSLIWYMPSPHCNGCFAPSPHTQNQLVQHFLRMMYQSSPAVVGLGWLPPTFLTAVPMVWNAFQARETTLLLIPNSVAILVTVRPSSSFPINLPRVKSSSDEAHFWLNGYVNKQNCRIWSEANPQVYVEIPLHPEKLTVWCVLWAGRILLQKR